MLLARLARELERVWEESASRLPGGITPHRIRFSRRITDAWALIYYRKREVRLSPYLFLVPPDRRKRASDWKELEATILHEVAHAHLWARTRDAGHPPEFADLLRALGVRPNGACDLGPENPAWRYRYECPTCDRGFLRRLPLRSASSCARCAPAGYDAAHRLRLASTLPSPWTRLATVTPRIERAIAEGEERALVVDPRLTVRFSRTR